MSFDTSPDDIEEVTDDDFGILLDAHMLRPMSCLIHRAHVDGRASGARDSCNNDRQSQ
jgi:hypothetical protein